MKGNVFSSFANTIESNQKQIFFFLQKHSIYHFALQNKLSRIGKQYFRLRNINNTNLTFSFEFHFPSRPDFNLILLLPTGKKVAVKLLLKQYIQCTHPLGIISLCFIQSVPRKMLFHKNVTLFTEIAIFPVQAMFRYNVHNFGTKFLFKSFLAEINSLQCQCYMSCQEKPQFMQFFSLSKRCKNTIGSSHYFN